MEECIVASEGMRFKARCCCCCRCDADEGEPIRVREAEPCDDDRAGERKESPEGLLPESKAGKGGSGPSKFPLPPPSREFTPPKFRLNPLEDVDSFILLKLLRLRKPPLAGGADPDPMPRPRPPPSRDCSYPAG